MGAHGASTGRRTDEDDACARNNEQVPEGPRILLGANRRATRERRALEAAQTRSEGEKKTPHEEDEANQGECQYPNEA